MDQEQDGMREHLHESRQARVLDAVPVLSTRGMAPSVLACQQSANKLEVEALLTGARMRFRADTCQAHVRSANSRLS